LNDDRRIIKKRKRVIGGSDGVNGRIINIGEVDIVGTLRESDGNRRDITMCHGDVISGLNLC
jgi:hypothetical protein